MAAVIDIASAWPGATPEDWAHFDVLLGLTADLLPVVSNSRAVVAPHSTLKAVGKVPSLYNGQRQAVGMANWTQRQSTPEEIAAWARERDYGISLQTRRIRALDVDVTDPEEAAAIRTFIGARYALPARVRATSSKFLVAFDCAGELAKRVVKTRHGMVEWLCTGQQFIACGAHVDKDLISRSRYEWDGGLPNAFPVLTLKQAEQLWSELAATFGVEAPTESQASIKAGKLSEAIDADPVAQFLLNAGRVKRTERDGRLHITCPFEAEHTGDSGETSTTYWPAHTGGYVNGHFRCLHAHCEHREDREFLDAIEYVDAGLMSEFTALASPAPVADPDAPQPIKADVTIDTAATKPARFQVLTAAQFAQGKPLTWFIKGVLPRAELGMVYGESTAGKTFAVLDMAAHIAMGRPWRGLVTRQMRVMYVAAEGASGMRNRLKAIAQHLGVELADLPIKFIADAPNLMEKADALEIAKAIVAAGGADLVVLDTFAQVMAGGNENSGEDVGRVLAHCRGINRATGGAMVLPVHHSGKDASRGARGWSGIKAAMDVELEVVRAEERRSITVTKIKDGPGEGKEYAFRLNTVVLGLDEDGEEITSCVVEHAEGAVRKDRGPRGAIEKLVLNTLEDMAGVGAGVVLHVDLKERAKSQMPYEEGTRDTRGQRVERALESLIASRHVVRDGTGVRMKGSEQQ